MNSMFHKEMPVYHQSGLQLMNLVCNCSSGLGVELTGVFPTRVGNTGYRDGKSGRIAVPIATAR